MYISMSALQQILRKGERSMEKDALLNLAGRINTTNETARISTETIRWKALREAESLDDPGLFPLLQETITENDGKGAAKQEIRSAAYFIYGRLLEKAFFSEDCAFFLQRLGKETGRALLSSMLDRVKDWRQRAGILLPLELDTTPVRELTRSRYPLVRHSALHALSACPGAENREALAFYLTQEDEKAYQYEIYYANIAMQSIGEAGDIPLLERFLKSRRPDLKITAQYAIRYITDRDAAKSVLADDPAERR